MLSDEAQLGYALEAFGWAHNMPPGWATINLRHCKNAGITTMNDLALGCKGNTINLDLELFGIPPEEQFSETTIQYLRNFLPGPVGFRCFRLAQKAAEKVKKGLADTEYVHRPENGTRGEEQWKVPVDDEWVMHVDCAGFVRSCLKHVTKDKWVMSLSDRDFMRAKDFFAFFDSVPFTVMDREDIPEGDIRMKWRRVPDLRMIIPGDIICYRPRGNAAGGAAFTTSDRKDLTHVLRAVKTAQLWHEERDRLIAAAADNSDHNHWDSLVTQNKAKDPVVKPWIDAVKAKLQAVHISTVRELRTSLPYLNELLVAKGYRRLFPHTMEYIRECVYTTAMNTGHIVFASGPAQHKGDDEYRIRVVHSTKFGKRDENGIITTGVQEHYRRFNLIRGNEIGPDGRRSVRWTRKAKAKKKATTPTTTATSTATTISAVPTPVVEETSEMGPPRDGRAVQMTTIPLGGSDAATTTSTTAPSSSSNTSSPEHRRIPSRTNSLYGEASSCGTLSDDEYNPQDDIAEDPVLDLDEIAIPTAALSDGDLAGGFLPTIGGESFSLLVPPEVEELNEENDNPFEDTTAGDDAVLDELAGQCDVDVVAVCMCF